MMVEQRTQRPMGLLVSDYQKRQAFVDADPSYQELEQAALAFNKQLSDINHKRASALWKIRRLLTIRDLAISQACSLEDADTDASENLKTYTGEDSEEWHCTVMTGVEDLTQVIYRMCGDVGAADFEHTCLDENRKAAWEKARAKADELRKVWDLMQTETKDSTNV